MAHDSKRSIVWCQNVRLRLLLVHVVCVYFGAFMCVCVYVCVLLCVCVCVHVSSCMYVLVFVCVVHVCFNAS